MLLDWVDLKVKIKHPDSNIYYNVNNVYPVYHNNQNVLCIEIEREVNQK
jgi:predicted transport protein